MSNGATRAYPEGYDPHAILADPDAHLTHKKIAEVNIRVVERGERWAKCYTCGEPFHVVEVHDSTMFCGPACEIEAQEDFLS